jgi:hypothetical protein
MREGTKGGCEREGGTVHKRTRAMTPPYHSVLKVTHTTPSPLSTCAPTEGSFMQVRHFPFCSRGKETMKIVEEIDESVRNLATGGEGKIFTKQIKQMLKNSRVSRQGGLKQ